MEEDELSDVIGGIYDAALDPSLWPGVLESVVALWNGQAVCIIKRDLETDRCGIIHQAGLPPLSARLNIHRYLRLTPLNAALLSGPADRIRADDLLPPDRFHRTRFYRNWMAPYGWRALVFVPIARTQCCVITLALFYCDPQADEACALGPLILPHLAHALKIEGSLEKNQTQVAGLEATFDSLKPSVFLLNQDGTVRQTNANASAMLQQGQLLRVVAGELRFRDEEANRCLRSAAALAGNDSHGAVSTAISITSGDGERYIGRFLQLPTKPTSG